MLHNNSARRGQPEPPYTHDARNSAMPVSSPTGDNLLAICLQSNLYYACIVRGASLMAAVPLNNYGLVQTMVNYFCNTVFLLFGLFFLPTFDQWAPNETVLQKIWSADNVSWLAKSAEQIINKE